MRIVRKHARCVNSSDVSVSIVSGSARSFVPASGTTLEVRSASHGPDRRAVMGTPCGRLRHAPVKPDEADPARAVGTLFPVHAQTGTVRLLRGSRPHRRERVLQWLDRSLMRGVRVPEAGAILAR